MAKPLEGILVVDLTRVLAGPFCTMLMADMGADVIKVENPKTGDDSRAFTPFKNGVSAYFMGLNRSKRSITINLKEPEGKELLKKLVTQADVLVENYKPGTMEKLGLSYATLKEINPRLVYAAISGFGQTGPYSAKAAYDLIIQGMSGFMSITGMDAAHPLKSGSSIADIFAGIFAVTGILAALRHRDKTGEGQMVDVAMLDCMISVLENALACYDSTGISPEPIGNGHRSISPFSAFTTSDGFINICAGNDDLWRRLCEVIGMEKYITDERFVNNRGRVENFPALAELANERLFRRTTAEWREALDAAKVPCGPIMNIEQVVSDPQVKDREMVIKQTHPEAGDLTIPGVPVKFSVTPASISSPAPLLGEHTNDILETLLGLKESEIAILKDKKVI